MIESVRFDSARGRSRRGVSLIEILIILAMLATIAAIVIPRLQQARLVLWPQAHLGQVVQVGEKSALDGKVATHLGDHIICQSSPEDVPTFIHLVNPELVKQWSEATQKMESSGMICGFILSKDSPGPKPFADGVTYDAVDFKLLAWQEKVYVSKTDLDAIATLQNR